MSGMAIAFLSLSDDYDHSYYRSIYCGLESVLHSLKCGYKTVMINYSS